MYGGLGTHCIGPEFVSKLKPVILEEFCISCDLRVTRFTISSRGVGSEKYTSALYGVV